MKTSLIIATYNWPEALELVFLSVLKQSKLPEKSSLQMMGQQMQQKK